MALKAAGKETHGVRAEAPKPERWLAGNKPLAAGIGFIAVAMATGLGFLAGADAARDAAAAVDGGIWLAAAAVLAIAFGYGIWCGRRPRRIRAEQQLDMVTKAALEVRDLMRDAAPQETAGARAVLRLIGGDCDDDDDDRAAPGTGTAGGQEKAEGGPG